MLDKSRTNYNSLCLDSSLRHSQGTLRYRGALNRVHLLKFPLILFPLLSSLHTEARTISLLFQRRNQTISFTCLSFMSLVGSQFTQHKTQTLSSRPYGSGLWWPLSSFLTCSASLTSYSHTLLSSLEGVLKTPSLVPLLAFEETSLLKNFFP